MLQAQPAGVVVVPQPDRRAVFFHWHTHGPRQRGAYGARLGRGGVGALDARRAGRGLHRAQLLALRGRGGGGMRERVSAQRGKHEGAGQRGEGDRVRAASSPIPRPTAASLPAGLRRPARCCGQSRFSRAATRPAARLGRHDAGVGVRREGRREHKQRGRHERSRGRGARRGRLGGGRLCVWGAVSRGGSALRSAPRTQPRACGGARLGGHGRAHRGLRADGGQHRVAGRRRARGVEKRQRFLGTLWWEFVTVFWCCRGVWCPKMIFVIRDPHRSPAGRTVTTESEP